MQLDTQESYPTRTYADMHGKPTTNHKPLKTPLQAFLDALREIVCQEVEKELQERREARHG